MMQYIDRAQHQLEVTHRSDLLRLMREVDVLSKEVDRLKATLSERDRMPLLRKASITIRVSGHMRNIRLSDIVYCQSDGNYTRIFLQDGTALFVAKTLKAMEKLMGCPTMLRCHQSYLVNQSYVQGYESGRGLVLQNAQQPIPVSRRLKRNVLQRIDQISAARTQ